MRAGHVSHRRTSAFDDHLYHSFAVLENVQLSFFLRELCVRRNLIYVRYIHILIQHLFNLGCDLGLNTGPVHVSLHTSHPFPDAGRLRQIASPLLLSGVCILTVFQLPRLRRHVHGWILARLASVSSCLMKTPPCSALCATPNSLVSASPSPNIHWKNLIALSLTWHSAFCSTHHV